MTSEGRSGREDGMRKHSLSEGRAVLLGELEIAVFNVGKKLLAVENRCLHLGGPLSDGIVSGGRDVCPLHAWKIGLDDGEVRRTSPSA